MLAKIEGDAVQRALELAGVQFIDCRRRRRRARAPAAALGYNENRARWRRIWGYSASCILPGAPPNCGQTFLALDRGECVAVLETNRIFGGDSE